MGLLIVALLFPAWFFVQSAFSPGANEDAGELLRATGWLMPLLFVLVPSAVLVYWKVDLIHGLALHRPSTRHVAAGVLIGLSAWVLAYEVNVLQHAVIGIPKTAVESAEVLTKTLAALPVASVFVLIALVPAVCEELLFRGLLLRSLATTERKWAAILASAAVFGLFHFVIFKFLVTAVLGALLGYLCWQSRSVLPAVVAHFLHNAIGAYTAINPGWTEWIGLDNDAPAAHLPPHILVAGGLVLLIGLLLCSRSAAPKDAPWSVQALGSPQANEEPG